MSNCAVGYFFKIRKLLLEYLLHFLFQSRHHKNSLWCPSLTPSKNGQETNYSSNF